MDPQTKLLDPRQVARLGSLDLVARVVVDGFLRGVHRSARRGSSVEFAENRPYVPGDAIARIDWRAFGKTDRLYLREYEDETNLRLSFVLDTSASMGFASAGVSKLRYASCLLAALGHLAHEQLDAVGVLTFDDKPRLWAPPRASLLHFRELLGQIEQLAAAGPTRIGDVLRHAAEALPSRGLVVVLSDLLDDAGDILRGLARLRAGKSEVAVFHIVDPAETAFPFRSWTVFRDPESPRERVRLDARWVRDIYLRNFREHARQIREGCRASRIDYHLVHTENPLELVLWRYLTARRRHGAG